MWHSGVDANRSTACRICSAQALHPVGTVDGYPFWECRECCFTFTPALTQARIEELYSAGYHGPEDGAPTEGWADPSFLEPAFNLLGRERPLRILDFGAGQSFLPKLLRAQGHRVIAVDVVEPLEPDSDYLTGSLCELDLEPRQFDLCFAFQVFEHLAEPRPYLEELLRLARPGGLVLIHTDMHTPEREAGFTNWWYVSPPDHCAFYRHQTFEVFLRGTPHRMVWRDPKEVIIEARAA